MTGRSRVRRSHAPTERNHHAPLLACAPHGEADHADRAESGNARAAAGRRRTSWPSGSARPIPAGTDLKPGKHARWSTEDGGLRRRGRRPRAGRPGRGHGQPRRAGSTCVPIGETGLWARVELIPTDTKFAYSFPSAARTLRRAGRSRCPSGNTRPSRASSPAGATARRSRSSSAARSSTTTAPAGSTSPPPTSPHGPPAALMVFQDGDAYKKEHVGTVVDNLIAAKEMPVTILLLLNPGVNDDGTREPERRVRHAGRLATSDVPRERGDPALRRKTTRSATTPPAARSAGRARGRSAPSRPPGTAPTSSAGSARRSAASPTSAAANAYPSLIRESPEEADQGLPPDGTNDLINQYGDWWQANEAMDAALKQKGYDVDSSSRSRLPRLLDLRPPAPRGPPPHLGRDQAVTNRLLDRRAIEVGKERRQPGACRARRRPAGARPARRRRAGSPGRAAGSIPRGDATRRISSYRLTRSRPPTWTMPAGHSPSSQASEDAAAVR